MYKTIFLVLLLYIGYRFLFGFVLPVAKATRQVRKQFKAAQQNMEDQMKSQQQFQQNSYAPNSEPAKSKPSPSSKGDYLEFEEIK